VQLLDLSGPEVHGVLPLGACANATRDPTTKRTTGDR
jgi:hypothetical protein